MNHFNLLKEKLNKYHISHELIHLDVKTLSVDDHVKAAGINYNQGVSTLLFRTKENKYVAILRRDDTKFDNNKLKDALNTKKLYFCDETDLKKLDIERGLTAPLILNDIQRNFPIYIFVDKKVLEQDVILCGSASSNHALKIQTNELLKNIGNYKVIDVTIPNMERSANIDIIKENKINNQMKKRILTGDRPTGYLHVGHLVGSLQNRVKLQSDYDTFIMVADVQALTDNFSNPEKIRDNLLNTVKSNIAVGVDPTKVIYFIQSLIPEIAELTIYYANLVSIQKLGHNPTVKTELAQKGFEESTPLGFFMYPVSQAADITIFNANLVPVGDDQAPMIEDTREIAKKFNQIYGETITLPEGLYGEISRLPGSDGNAKMGKSLGNAIYLNESTENLKKKIMGMKTDPKRVHATDPGEVENNPVFIYHDAFNPNKEEVDDLKNRYRQGNVGDVEVKEKLFTAMENLLAPIREKIIDLDGKHDYLMEIVMEGTKKARLEAQNTMKKVREAMKINY